MQMTTLFVACRSREAQCPTWGPVARLDRTNRLYRFCYTRGARTLPGFQSFEEMPNLEEVYESDTLFPLFANRLLSPSRPEYQAFLQWGGFSAQASPAPIAVLSVTEGIRQTDGIEVFPCPVFDEQGYYNKFFLHGIRWLPPEAIERISALKRHERLAVKPDPGNPFDQNAVSVHTETGNVLIGYVPRYLAHDVSKLLEGCCADSIEVYVERLNLDAPLQHRVLCRMSACWPEGFRPCSDDVFAPIPANMPSADEN